MSDLEQLLFELTNKQRLLNRRRPFVEAPALSLAARRHSEDMLRRRFFSHVNPDKKTPSDRITAVLKWTAPMSAENLWMRTGALPPGTRVVEEAVATLMASRPHRTNILNSNYTHLGVGIATTATEVRVTQLFARFER